MKFKGISRQDWARIYTFTKRGGYPKNPKTLRNWYKLKARAAGAGLPTRNKELNQYALRIVRKMDRLNNIWRSV